MDNKIVEQFRTAYLAACREKGLPTDQQPMHAATVARGLCPYPEFLRAVGYALVLQALHPDKYLLTENEHAEGARSWGRKLLEGYGCAGQPLSFTIKNNDPEFLREVGFEIVWRLLFPGFMYVHHGGFPDDDPDEDKIITTAERLIHDFSQVNKIHQEIEK